MTPARTRNETTPDTKQRIVETARELLSEGGYHNASLSDIAARVGITKAALYYHFPSKTDIYAAVLESVRADMEQLLQQALSERDARARLEAIVDSYLNFWMREMNVLSILVGKLSIEETCLRDSFLRMREEVRALICPVVAEAVSQSPLFKDIDPSVLTILVTAMLDGLLLEASLLGGPIDPDMLTKQIEPAFQMITRQLD
ncbi:MAG: TetR/AcrR family transcriptional regulator [Coriobacteriia bacterium]